MLVAYPERKKWADNSLDCEASKLAGQPKVKQRHDDLLSRIRAKEQKQVEWTREKALAKGLQLITYGEREIDRIEQASNDELALALEELDEIKDMEDLKAIKSKLKEIYQKKKARRLSLTAISAIKDGITVLNKMAGFDNLNIALSNNSIATEQKNMKALSIEELRKIARAKPTNNR
jgi:hypothetical protein